jgi:hypothetical protein
MTRIISIIYHHHHHLSSSIINIIIMQVPVLGAADGPAAGALLWALPQQSTGAHTG